MKRMKRLRVLLRPWCLVMGHYNVMDGLPEEWGLYLYTRLYCGRCEMTFDRMDPLLLADLERIHNA